MDINISKQLKAEVDELITGNLSLELGKKASLINLIFLYRLVLGRDPSDQELCHLSFKAENRTLRECIAEVVDSDEFAHNYAFMPPKHILMSEKPGFRFFFNTSDREMGVKMALGIYEPSVTEFDF